MEFACKGTILNYLDVENRKSLTEMELAIVANSVLRGLKCMHKRHVIHRDVKPGNILITCKGKVKLGDLGTACVALMNRHSVQGTFQYLAPEIFLSQSYDAKVDVWALGMTLLELAQGFNPFQSEHIARVLYHLVEAPSPPSLLEPETHSPEFVDFLSRCLTLKASERPAAAQLLKHPFLKKTPSALPIPKMTATQKKIQMANLLAIGPGTVSPVASEALNAHARRHSHLSTSQEASTSTSTTNASTTDRSSSISSEDSEELPLVQTTPTTATIAATSAKCSIVVDDPESHTTTTPPPTRTLCQPLA